MKRIILLVIVLAFVACNSGTSTKEAQKTDSTAIPTFAPACDTVKISILYVKGNQVLADSASSLLRCGVVSSLKPGEFAKVDGIRVILSDGTTEINPQDVRWYQAIPKK